MNFRNEEYIVRVALVHYWLLGMRGGEKVLESLCELFPTADIYTHVYNPSEISSEIRRHNIQTSFIQRLPLAKRLYQKYLPLMPMALEQLDLTDYDLVISSESGPAKGVVTSPNSLHVCYCHSPMRYVWDLYHDYFNRSSVITKIIMPPVMHYMRMWDLSSSFRVDNFIANSDFVASRILKYYHRDSTVIHPPVDVGSFSEIVSSVNEDDFYLMVGQLVPYKRVDLAIKVFNKSKKRLVIIGDGEQLTELRKIAAPNVCLLGRRSFSVIKRHFATCKALIFPGLEDFGIVPVEAMSSGRPVIAYGRGGVLETVIDGKTGVLFYEQTEDALAKAIKHFESLDVYKSFPPDRLRAHAALFEKNIFKDKMQNEIERLLTNHSKRLITQQ